MFIFATAALATAFEFPKVEDEVTGNFWCVGLSGVPSTLPCLRA